MKLKKISTFDVGMDFKTHEFVSNQLTLILADQYILFTQLNSFHWNIKGSNFGPLHELFEKGYKMIFEDFDVVAERIVQLGYFCNATIKNFLQYTRLNEQEELDISDEEMLKILIRNFEILIRQIRELAVHTESNYKDLATNNFMAELLEKYEKYLWILRSNL